MVAQELGVTLPTETVNPWSPESTVSQANPLGKIPVLILGPQEAIYDSAVIVEYLVAHAPNNAMLGTDLHSRFQIKTQEALADGILDAAVSIVLERRRDPAQQSESTMQRAREAIARGFDAFAQQLPPTEPLTVASIALAVAMGYVAFRLPELNLAHPPLRAWLQTVSQRPSYRDTVPVG